MTLCTEPNSPTPIRASDRHVQLCRLSQVWLTKVWCFWHLRQQRSDRVHVSMNEACPRARLCMPAWERSAVHLNARRIAHLMVPRSIHGAVHCVLVWLRGPGEGGKREGAMWIQFSRKLAYMSCNRYLGDPGNHTLRSPLMSMRPLRSLRSQSAFAFFAALGARSMRSFAVSIEAEE